MGRRATGQAQEEKKRRFVVPSNEMRLRFAGELSRRGGSPQNKLFTLGGLRTGCLNRRLQQLPEIFQSGSGDDNRIAAATDILGYAQKAAAGIFFQRKNEKLALNLNSIGLNGVLGCGRLGV